MKIEVTISDEWIEEQSLDEALIDAIRSTLLRELVDKFKPQVEGMFTKLVNEEAGPYMAKTIQRMLDDIIAGGYIKPLGHAQPVLIKDYLLAIFSENSGWRNPVDQMKAIAKESGNQLKQRYDLNFATLVVDNMRKQGLLKDDVAQMLLADNGGGATL